MWGAASAERRLRAQARGRRPPRAPARCVVLRVWSRVLCASRRSFCEQNGVASRRNRTVADFCAESSRGYGRRLKGREKRLGKGCPFGDLPGMSGAASFARSGRTLNLGLATTREWLQLHLATACRPPCCRCRTPTQNHSAIAASLRSGGWLGGRGEQVLGIAGRSSRSRRRSHALDAFRFRLGASPSVPWHPPWRSCKSRSRASLRDEARRSNDRSETQNACTDRRVAKGVEDTQIGASVASPSRR